MPPITMPERVRTLPHPPRRASVAAWILLGLAALVLVLGALATAGMIREYGQSTGALNLAMQVAIFWAPPALLFGGLGLFLRRRG